MRMLFEITNMITGAHHFALHENCDTVRGVIREVETALGEVVADETKMVVTREMRPEADIESFFAAHEDAMGGTWSRSTETLWIFKSTENTMQKPIPTLNDPWVRWARLVGALFVSATVLALFGSLVEK